MAATLTRDQEELTFFSFPNREAGGHRDRQSGGWHP